MEKRVRIYQTKPELVQAAAEKIAETVERAVKERGRCAAALSGGNTPREVYQSLAAAALRTRIDWRKFHLFWGDERMVPPDHAESNFGMVRDAMLSHGLIPEANVHRIRGEIAPEQAASEYAAELRRFFRDRPMQLDLVLLGIGEDGHTASLFPGANAVTETTQPATAVFVPKLDKWRVTLTFPVINRAREVVFLVAGKSKSEIVKLLFELDKPDSQWPASMVQPENGVLHWLLDAEAASLIKTTILLEGKTI
jgi:6-phosphogluconolactonase